MDWPLTWQCLSDTIVDVQAAMTWLIESKESDRPFEPAQARPLAPDFCWLTIVVVLGPNCGRGSA